MKITNELANEYYELDNEIQKISYMLEENILTNDRLILENKLTELLDKKEKYPKQLDQLIK